MKYTNAKAYKKRKHGILLHVYTDRELPQANICTVSCEKGHFQEFYDRKSTFIYYAISGKGTFYLNGKPVPVKATDLIVAKPRTKIYYLGKLKMLLAVVPAWQAKNEVHVRHIPRN